MTTDFNAHLALVRADAEAKAAEAKKLMETVRIRALETFDIVGRLNVLGAERVVQVGKPSEHLGILMFVVDEQAHGTLLTFGSSDNPSGFHRLCWCCVNGMSILEKSLDAAYGLRSWDLGTNDHGKELVMTRIREAVEAGEYAWIENPDAARLQRLAPLLDIEQKKSSPLRLMSLTPKEWWTSHTFDHLRAKE